MARQNAQMPKQSPISRCDPALRNMAHYPEPLKYLTAISNSGRVTGSEHLSFPQFDVRKAKTADV
jgi:hypothetical protein